MSHHRSTSSRTVEAFPPTMLSAILGTRSDASDVRKRSWNRVAEAYHEPTVSYLRVRFRKSEEDAKDIANAFFARCIERDTLAAFEPGRARFRTFFRVCLDRFTLDEHRLSVSQRRGGGARPVELDEAAVDAAMIDNGELDPDAIFEAEWVRRIVALAVEALRDECIASGKTQHFAVFERYHLKSEEAPSYVAIAEELGLSVSDVTNRLHFARRKLRSAVLDVLRELSASEDEWRSEARAVLGVDP